MWKYYALLSALFAALTAVFAKIGVKRSIRIWLRLSGRQSSCLSLGESSLPEPYGRGERHQRTYMDIPYSVRCRHRPLVAVLLQGIAGGGCIACGTDRQIERGDYHLSLLSVSERAGQPAGYHRGIAHYGRQYRNVNKVEEYEDIDYRRRTKSFG